MNRGRRVVYTLYVSIALPADKTEPAVPLGYAVAPVLVATMGLISGLAFFAAFLVDIYTAWGFTFSFPSLYH